jgi:hypothetical protein
MKYELPAGVKLEILDPDTEREDRQDSAFYTWYPQHQVARLTYNGKSYVVECVGEMRIIYNDEVIRYCDDLIRAGFTNDSELYQLEDKGGEWVNNSWFEVYDETEGEYTTEVYHEVKEAIESVANWIREEAVA